jgi:hypothetical protein
LFDQAPGEAVSVWPSSVVPVIVGRAVFAGGGGRIVALAVVVALPEPPALVAVTVARMVWPTSALVSL